jgi:mono/diheme cytochrome c family protein
MTIAAITGTYVLPEQVFAVKLRVTPKSECGLTCCHCGITRSVMRGRRTVLRTAIPVLVVFASLLVVALAGAHRTVAPTAVTVTLTDTSAKLSKSTVPIGSKITFTVTNKGKKNNSFTIGAKKTPKLAPGKKASLSITYSGEASVVYFVNAKQAGTLKVATVVAPSGGSTSAAAIADGKQVFNSAGCKSCHTLKAAGATGTIGPNLDQVKPGIATVVSFVTNGYSGVGAAVPMPSFQGQLSATKIKDVAAFVYASTH